MAIRRARIAVILEREWMTIQQLAERMSLTDHTIRGDLLALAGSGEVERRKRTGAFRSGHEYRAVAS